MIARTSPSVECVNHWRVCCRRELRMPQVQFYFGMLGTLATVALEVVVRSQGLAAGADHGLAASADAGATRARALAGLATVLLFMLYPAAEAALAAAKMFRSVKVFSGETSDDAKAEREALAAGRAPWFASLGSDELRQHVAAYWREFGAGPYANPNPAQFRDYLRLAMRARGHGDLSHQGRVACATRSSRSGCRRCSGPSTSRSSRRTSLRPWRCARRATGGPSKKYQNEDTRVL